VEAGTEQPSSIRSGILSRKDSTLAGSGSNTSNPFPQVAKEPFVAELAARTPLLLAALQRREPHRSRDNTDSHSTDTPDPM
jgi:hypothetical protein